MEVAARANDACWRCGSAVGTALVCAGCDAPQPVAANADLWSLFGLSPALKIDLLDLEQRYHTAARALHPDRHQNAEARGQQLSVAATAAINRAYRTLRDPVTRGKYWLERHGVRLNADNRVPPSLAMLVFETQERLEEFRAANGANLAALRVQIESMRGTLAQRLTDLQQGLGTRYTAWTPLAAAQPAALDDLKQQLAEINYLRTLLGDVEETLGDPRGTDRRH